jgi:uncharacterized protein YkwD
VQRAAILIISVLVAVLAAVGVSAANPERAQAAGGGHVKTCDGGEIFLSQKEKKTFVLHNQIRRERGLPAFCVHPKLQKAARAHSEDMIRRDYFSHDTKGRQESACERIRRYGYNWQLCAENIALGSGSSGEPDSIMRGWMRSEGHRRNILNRKLREIGIGTHTGTFTYEGTDYKDTTMYTADFGTSRG